MKYSVQCIILCVVLLTPCWAAHEVITPTQQNYGRLVSWRDGKAVLTPEKKVITDVLAILFHRTGVVEKINSDDRFDKIILVTGDVLLGSVIEIDATHVVFMLDGHNAQFAVLRQRVEMVVFAQ